VHLNLQVEHLILAMAALCAHTTANLHSLIAQAKQIREQNQEMAAVLVEEPINNAEPAQDRDGGTIWQQIDDNQSWATLTNFKKHDILSIYKELLPSLPSQ
jgi:hypothetical protein